MTKKIVFICSFTFILMCACSLGNPTLNATQAPPPSLEPSPFDSAKATQEMAKTATVLALLAPPVVLPTCFDDETCRSASATVAMANTFAVMDLENNPLNQATEAMALTLTAFQDSSEAETGITPSPEPCAFVWADKALPDETKILTDTLLQANLTNVSASAYAFGENCITASGQVQGFSTLETDFKITVNIDNLADTESLGNSIQKIVAVLQSFPEDTFPGHRPGRVEISFTAGSNTKYLWFTLDDGIKTIEEGCVGTCLYNRYAN